MDFEIRNIVQENPVAVLDCLIEAAAVIAASHRKVFPEADIRIDVLNAYSALATPADAEIVRFASSLVEAPNTSGHGV